MARSATAQKPVEPVAPPVNLMANAPIAPSRQPPKAADRVYTTEVVGLRPLVALGEHAKTVASMMMLDSIPIHSGMMEYFVADGCRTGQTPQNYKGVEGEASASMQLRRKASNQPLTAEVVEALDHYEIPYGDNVIQPGTFIVNPDYIGDPDMIKRAGEALGAAGLPPDFILQQLAAITQIATDETLTTIFDKFKDDSADTAKARAANRRNHVIARTLLQHVAYPTISGKWDGDPNEAANISRDLVFADTKKPAEDRAVVKAKILEKTKEDQREKARVVPVPATRSLTQQLAMSLQKINAEGESVPTEPVAEKPEVVKPRRARK